MTSVNRQTNIAIQTKEKKEPIKKSNHKKEKTNDVAEIKDSKNTKNHKSSKHKPNDLDFNKNKKSGSQIVSDVKKNVSDVSGKYTFAAGQAKTFASVGKTVFKSAKTGHVGNKIGLSIVRGSRILNDINNYTEISQKNTLNRAAKYAEKANMNRSAKLINHLANKEGQEKIINRASQMVTRQSISKSKPALIVKNGMGKISQSKVANNVKTGLGKISNSKVGSIVKTNLGKVSPANIIFSVKTNSIKLSNSKPVSSMKTGFGNVSRSKPVSALKTGFGKLSNSEFGSMARTGLSKISRAKVSSTIGKINSPAKLISTGGKFFSSGMSAKAVVRGSSLLRGSSLAVKTFRVIGRVTPATGFALGMTSAALAVNDARHAKSWQGKTIHGARAIINTVGAGASFVPGVGTAVSIGATVLDMGLDFWAKRSKFR